MNSKRRITNKMNCIEEQSHFKNLRIKVNGRTLFKGCRFVNCTFTGKRKELAVFHNCINS